MSLKTIRLQPCRASVKAPVNIAVVKCWGKRNTGLNLLSNDSISVTLAPQDLCTHTTAAVAPSGTHDTLSLNGAPPRPITDARTRSCLAQLRALRVATVETCTPDAPHLTHLPLAITTRNNFPTAAGVASSASGFAALVSAVALIYGLPTPLNDISRIARAGSGSACRSLFGGFVQWHAGIRADGLDSTASQLAPASHWPQVRALILIASAAQKAVGSTDGMQRTAATSVLFAHCVTAVVPAQARRMQDAIASRDWETFASVTMEESNSFHATCLDTSPPIFYMNQTSVAAVQAVEAINAFVGRTVAAYTFDAGPNAVVFYQEQDEEMVWEAFEPALGELLPIRVKEAGQAGVVLSEEVVETLRKGISRVIPTGVGEGCHEVSEHVKAPGS
jgi:diphosphomevalonate decarboxylase